MAEIKRKTYDNSFLFNQEANKHQMHIADFILKSQRINKKTDAFKMIVQDVKRYQSSSILSTVLEMDDVVLCIPNVEMPAAFKVFEAKDLRLDKKPKVFIDCYGLINLTPEGFFVCKNIDKLITYLFNALGYLLYQKQPIKLLNNANLTISGTECFVAMYTYIIDYLRIIGYSVNKPKIMYLTGLYYQYHMLDKDLNQYTKQIAGKIAGIGANEIKAYDLYFNEEDFIDINTFTTMITNTFKLKGFNTEVLIGKWCYLFGKGTQYATELFTSFSTLLTSAYCGTYIVGQKQIERCCATSMVKFCQTLMKVGVDEFDRRAYMSESELDSLIKRDPYTLALRESLISKVPDDAKFGKDDYLTKANASARFKKVIAYYKSVNKLDKVGDILKSATIATFKTYKRFVAAADNGYSLGTLETIVKLSTSYYSDKVRDKLFKDFDDFDKKLQEDIKKTDDKEKQNRFAKSLVEIRNAKNAL